MHYQLHREASTGRETLLKQLNTRLTSEDRDVKKTTPHSATGDDRQCIGRKRSQQRSIRANSLDESMQNQFHAAVYCDDIRSRAVRECPGIPLK